MPRKRITLADGRTAIVNFANEPTQDDLAQAADHIAATAPKTTGVTAPPPDPMTSPNALVRDWERTKQLASGVGQGLTETVQGVAAMPGLVAGIPGQVSQDVSALVSDPKTALLSQGQRAGKFALGMIPESLRAVNPLLSAASQAVGLPKPQLSTTGVGRDITLQEASRLVGVAKSAVRGALGPHSPIPGVRSAVATEAYLEAEPRLNALHEDMRPTQGAIDREYDTLHQMAKDAPPAQMNAVNDAARELIRREQQVDPMYRREGVLDELDGLVKRTADPWSHETAIATAQRLGAHLGSRPDVPKGISRLDTNEKAHLLSALHQDVEAASGPIAEQWRLANSTFKRNEAAKTLARWIDESKSVVGDQYFNFNVNAILKKIQTAENAASRGERGARLFTGGFEPGELRQVKQSLQELARTLPPSPTKRGVAVGSSERVKEAAVSSALGMPWYVVPVAREVVAQSLMTPKGRTLIRAAMHIDPSTGPTFRNILAAYLQTQAAQERGDMPQDLAQPTPQSAPTPAATPTPKPFQLNDQPQAKEQ